MRFLLDENTAAAVKHELESAGHEGILVAHLMPGATDREFVQRALTDGSIVITEDKDFGMLCFKEGLIPPGFVRVALRRLVPAAKASRIADVIEDEGAALVGHITTIEPARARRTEFPS